MSVSYAQKAALWNLYGKTYVYKTYSCEKVKMAVFINDTEQYMQ